MEKVRPFQVEKLAWAMQEVGRRRKPKPRHSSVNLVLALFKKRTG